uniref:C-type lectin domain-containing protein n=1 Tax=Castor canadensis TaxID=51338 RepID=A0A8C0ZMD2_CASCN
GKTDCVCVFLSTEGGCFSSQRFLWTAAGASTLLLSVCFITTCWWVEDQIQSNALKKHIFWLSSPGILIEASLLLSSIKNCCPLNRDPFQSSCYFFFMNTMTWTLSLNNCSGMGAHLVIINTQEEQEFLFHTKPRKREFYIGLTDQVFNSSFWDLTPTMLLFFSFWYVGEPNDIKNWNDVCCFLNMFQICEMPAIGISD